MNVVSELEAAGGRLWRRVDALAEHSGCDKLRAASVFVADVPFHWLVQRWW